MDTDKDTQHLSYAFLMACLSSDINKVRSLLHEGADINFRGGNLNATGLHYATMGGNEKCVAVLLENGADIEQYSGKWPGMPVIMLAAMNNRKTVVELLVKNGANVNRQRQGDKATALHIATSNGHFEIVETLLLNLACVDVINDDGVTPLCIASLEGHIKIAQLLILHGASVNAQSRKGYAPLHCSSQNGHLTIVETLISSGADVNICDEKNISALLFAVQNKHTDVARLLLQNNADYNVTRSTDGDNPLRVAVAIAFKDGARMLLEHGADPNARGWSGKTALHVCAQQGSSECMQILLDQGGDPHAKTYDTKMTPLQMAASALNTGVVELLLKAETNEQGRVKDVNNSTNVHRSVDQATKTNSTVTHVKILNSEIQDTHIDRIFNPRHFEFTPSIAEPNTREEDDAQQMFEKTEICIDFHEPELD